MNTSKEVTLHIVTTGGEIQIFRNIYGNVTINDQFEPFNNTEWSKNTFGIKYDNNYSK